MINCERAKGHAQMLLKLVPNVIGSGCLPATDRHSQGHDAVEGWSDLSRLRRRSGLPFVLGRRTVPL